MPCVWLSLRRAQEIGKCTPILSPVHLEGSVIVGQPRIFFVALANLGSSAVIVGADPLFGSPPSR